MSTKLDIPKLTISGKVSEDVVSAADKRMKDEKMRDRVGIENRSQLVAWLYKKFANKEVDIK